MDTITYNLDSQKAKIKGVATQQGDGWLVGGSVKKMPDNTFNIEHGKYTTCEETDHPHFYLAMTKAKVIPGKKVVTGPAYLVMEDVPIYFLGIPEGFFPINMGPKSGLLMPTYGEEYSKGFFLRDLGYYFTLGEYADLAVRGGFYTLGSWEASAASRYIKRYKYSGRLQPPVLEHQDGRKGRTGLHQAKQLPHPVDPLAGRQGQPGIDLLGLGELRHQRLQPLFGHQYRRHSLDADQLVDLLLEELGRNPFSLSANMAISQNSQNKSISVTLPTVVFNVSRLYPFKRKGAHGQGALVRENLDAVHGQDDQLGDHHRIGNLLPEDARQHEERHRALDPRLGVVQPVQLHQHLAVVQLHREVVFQETGIPVEPHDEPDRHARLGLRILPPLQLHGERLGLDDPLRHVRLHEEAPRPQDPGHPPYDHPRRSASPSPRTSSDPRYGYYLTRQTDSTGRFTTYSPYAVNAYGVPSSGKSMSMNFSLSQNLEMKVLSKRDTSGVKKIKLIDELRLSGSYNFLADSMKLSTISLSFRTTLFNNFGINLSATIDPYRVTPEGIRYDKLFFPGRITSTGWSFGYTFKSRDDRSQPAINDITSLPPDYANPFHDPYGTMDPVLRRQYMAQSYYDFSLPWNFGFNYAVNYSISYVNNGTTGYRKNVTQTVSLQRFAQPHAQDRHHVSGRLRHQGQQAHHLVDFHFTGPPLLANVLLVDSLRLPQELEFQHRRQGRIARGPEIRQEPVHVRQHVLTAGPPPYTS